MDISSLQVPKAGRSRFSKALPTPPEFDGRTQTTPRELPGAPPAPPPPMKTAALTTSPSTTSPSTTSLRSKAFDSPLPPLPIMAEPPRPRAQAGPIPRKPVAQLPTPPASVDPKAKSKAAKRQSSISSLLSEREGVNSLPPVPPKKSLDIANDIVSDKASEITSYTIIDHFPPPPPLKNPSRPRTPPGTVRPSAGLKDEEGGSVSLSPPSSLKSGSPRAGREIWRRRASSKSDASLVIAELKLPASNGSTASTSHPPPKKAEPTLLPPLPAKPDPKPVLPPPPPKQQQQSTTTLPPRTTSLPGRNIRPTKQAEPSDKGDEMGRLRKLTKLLRRDNDGDEEQKRLQKPLPGKSEQPEHQEYLNPPDMKGKPEPGKPEPPAKDKFAQQQQQQQQQLRLADAPANAPTAVAVKESLSPASSSDVSAPPPNEPGKPSGTAILRRPVGAVPARNLNQPEPQFEPSNENTTGTLIAQNTTTQTPTTLPPINKAGGLPHPRQRQQPPQPPPSTSPQSLHGHGPNSRSPTSTTGGIPVPSSTPASPSQLAAPTVPMAGFRRPPDAISTAAPNAQPQISSPAPPRTRVGLEEESYSLQELIASPPAASTLAPNSPFLTQPPAPINELETIAPHFGLDVRASKEELSEQQSMSAEAAAAVARFPRRQGWNVECTVDDVWPSNPLAERHYHCHVNHSKLLDSRNTNYPLSCQTCGVADAERRFMCTFCNLRICQSCADILVANGRDLRVVMAILREKGLMHGWDEHPKRGADQHT